jgi:ubiquinone/menaquinone biosynthesis C-methylase UbiE
MSPAVPDTTKNWLQAVRQDWDARAREDARAYINWPDIPNEEGAFFESGRFDYGRYVAPFLRKMQFDPHGKTALEIGCGIGRIAHWMSQDFGQYIGVDVSPEMVERAKAYGFPRTRFEVVSGGDLAGIPDNSVDFVFSFAVFQHVPDEAAIFNYFAETARVLRPGGIFRLHMKGLRPWALGRLQIETGFSNNRRLVEAGFKKVPMMRVRYLDTWQGRSIPPGKAVAKCRSLGLEVLDVEGEWTTMMWIAGRKK